MPGEIKIVYEIDETNINKAEARLTEFSDEADEKVLERLRESDMTQEEIAKKNELLKKEVDTEKVRDDAIFRNTRDEKQRVEAEVKRTETNSRETMARIRYSINAINDMLALTAALTGETMELHYLTMLSMGISAIMQIKAQAALYAATPGMQPLAMMMLAMIPLFTSVINFSRAETVKLQRGLDDQRTKRKMLIGEK